MKKIYQWLPAILLPSYAVYSAFVVSTISHSIILFSLASLFAWTQHLLSKSTPKLADEISKLKSVFDRQLEEQKEFYDKRLSEMEGEITKMSINAVKSVSSSKSQAETKRYVF